MTKLSLASLANLQNEQTAVSTINANSAATATALENTLSRDGTSPNQMNSELDMNSNRIINLPAPISGSEPLRVLDAVTLGNAGTITISNLPSGGTTGQALEKNSNASYDVKWATLPTTVSVPAGGTANQVLSKNTSTDYDISWKTVQGVREVLTTSRIYYVRSDGSDSNTGLADGPSTSFLTWQHAFDTISKLDINGQQVTVQHGVESGVVTFTAPNTINPMTGGGTIQVLGNSVVGKTVFNVVGADCFKAFNTYTPVNFDQMTLLGGTLGCISALYSSVITVGSNVHFGAAAFAHIYIHDRQAIGLMLGSSYKIDGGAGYHIFINGGMIFHESCVLTLTGTPNWTGSFANVINGGVLQCISLFTGGAATGQRFFATGNGVINTFGQGVNIFPGSVAGGTSAGGQYVP